METNHQKEPSDLDNYPTAELHGATSVAALAEVEGWSPDRYVTTLALNIRNDGVGLAAQTDRLRALSQIGAGADRAAASELSRHALLLNSLFEHLVFAAAKAVDAGGLRGAEAAQRLTSAAIRSQRAAAQCLGALKVLRDGAPKKAVNGAVGPDNDHV